MGSIKTFAYVTDIGITFHVKMDESNIEEVNDGIPPVVAGAYLLPIVSKLRYCNYASDDGLVRRKIPVLTPGNIVTLPATIVVSTGTGASPSIPVILSLKSTRGETFERATSSDTGLIDGDNP